MDKKKKRIPLDASQFLGGRYLRATDLPAGRLDGDEGETFTVESAVIDEYKRDGAEHGDRRLALRIAGPTERVLRLNDTNLKACIAAWGRDASQWGGRTFVAYNDTSVRNPQGARTGGVRMRFPDAVVLVPDELEDASPDDDQIPF